MYKRIEEKKHNLKAAYIENVIIWMVMFVGFATLFFFIIDYATVIRVKDNMDALSDYGARKIAVNGTSETTLNDLVARFNDMKVRGLANITAANLVCNSVMDDPAKYQVVFTTQTPEGTSIKFYNQQLVSTRAVYNESDAQTVTCTLTVTFAN